LREYWNALSNHDEGPVNLRRIDAKCVLLLGSGLLCAASIGCSTPAVGAPCLPEQVPETGFDDREAYIESSSVQCETRVCIVFRLRGDPRDGCVQNPAPACPEGDTDCVEPPRCADPEQVKQRVYCTCRCDSADTGFAECECPDDYTCVDVLEQGGPGVKGGYCVRNGTF
jgi:hypothetical protein